MNQTEYFVVLDDAHSHTSRYYQDFSHVDAIKAADLHQVDALLKQGWAQGLQVVLWQSYDFGVELVFGGAATALYLLWFKRCEVLTDTDAALPWIDAALSSFSLVAQYWAARRYRQTV